MVGKWALVTGATAGIGEATATLLAKSGFHLVLVGRRTERLAALKGHLQTQNQVQIRTLALDVRDHEQIRKGLLPLASELQQLTVLVNNAGLAKGTDTVAEAQVADWDAMIDTNIKGLLYMTREILPGMIKNKQGHIVNVGSVAGRWTYPGGAVYCATKFAVRALSEGLRYDLLGTPIRVTNIEPGMVETEFSQVRFDGDIERAKKLYAGLTPLSPLDVAEAILWTVQRPPHVNVQEMVIYPTDQAGVTHVHRR